MEYSTFTSFNEDSWAGWRAILDRVTAEVRELWTVCGRGAGKSRIAALLAAITATTKVYKVAPGEQIFIAVIAPDRLQARVTFNYCAGLLESVPASAERIISRTKHSLTLDNHVVIEVLTAKASAPRGRSYALVIVEEAAFLPIDTDANPDKELIRSIGPGLGRVPGSLLVVLSSPYARRGIIYDAWKRHQANPDDPTVVFVKAPTLQLNPTHDKRTIEKAYEDDPISAATEYGAEFRTDVEAFLTLEAIEACIEDGVFERPPRSGAGASGKAPTHPTTYRAFLDFAGGSGADSATLAIAHENILDVVREVRPPFKPALVCEDFAKLLKTYGITKATADRYAGQFPVDELKKHEITLEPSERSKSEIYRDVLPSINSGSVTLLDNLRLKVQLQTLERRVARGGKDSIDHPPGGHDDIANAVAGALTMAQPATKIQWGIVW